LDDWLCAERELLWAPMSEMTENNREYTLRIAPSGLEPGNVRVTATSETIVVQGKTTHNHKETDGEVRFCEFKEKLFRRIDFPSRINLDNISATLDKGMLHIVAAKAGAEEKRKRHSQVSGALSQRSSDNAVGRPIAPPQRNGSDLSS